ncbi:phosphatidylinositol alpha 1,6-mannosyltransferase [Nocardioides cavernae]|uniref:Phosphatidylinositol alpha 1,6-mannosyltransferase n=1 Tax=Nocardioides cavernae TaxID=1921566 RepID=A0A7Y9KR37_9ACTN|nr:glycosyltransferase family 1 protein [Nocardioides cavernae]NYE34902.1 phosphatidylinositol alpha 1,6-mannosyltransferase [Nocardioides cavernae]
MDLLERRRRSRTAPATLVPLPGSRPGSRTTSSPAAGGRLRVLVVTESFLPQVNGVTNSVRRVLEHLAAEGHEAELVAPTGPDTYAGFAVTHARGTNLPFYADFRIGLETRRRLRATMQRFRPDVVHIASPATLGYQAARAARGLAIPTVAIYQTDLVGFADRYAVPGGARAMEALTRRIHLGVDRTLAPSSASIAQLEGLGVHAVARWPRGVDQVLFEPGRRDEGLHAELAPHGEALVGYVGRLAPEKELELLAHVDRLPGVRVVVVGGGPEEARLRALLPGAAFLGVLHGDDLARTYATLDVFVHTGRHETYCQSAQEALASGVPVVAPRAGGPIDVVDDGVAGHLYEPGDAAGLVAHVERLVAQPVLRRRMAVAARQSVRERTWQSVNDLLVRHYRDVSEAPRSVRRAG